MLRRLPDLLSRRWNPRVLAVRAAVTAVAAPAIAWLGLAILPYVALAAAIFFPIRAARRIWKTAGQRVRQWRRQRRAERRSQPPISDRSVPTALHTDGHAESLAYGRVQEGGRGPRPGRRGAPPSIATRDAVPDRRGALLLPSGSRRRRDSDDEAQTKPAEQEIPSLTPDDFSRSIAAMARHGWHRTEAVRQIEGLGATWIWERTLRAPVKVQSAARDLPAQTVQADRQLHLNYRKIRALRDWLKPPIDIDLYFDRTGRLLGGAARLSKGGL